jgi:nitroreductase
MDAIEAILSRKVQRAFADTPVEDDKLAKIVEAGRHAMSARNLQPWQFIVVRDRERLKELGGRHPEGPRQRAMGRRRLRAGGAEHGDRRMGLGAGNLLGG